MLPASTATSQATAMLSYKALSTPGMRVLYTPTTRVGGAYAGELCYREDAYVDGGAPAQVQVVQPASPHADDGHVGLSLSPSSTFTFNNCDVGLRFEAPALFPSPVSNYGGERSYKLNNLEQVRHDDGHADWRDDDDGHQHNDGHDDWRDDDTVSPCISHS